MNHEIVGPEVTQVTGQLRIPKDIAISKHLAQFYNGPEWQEAMEEGYRQIDAEKKREQSITNSIGIEYDKLIRLPWAQQNLLLGLYDVENYEAARLIGQDLSLTKNDPLIHKLKVRTTALEIYANRRAHPSDWDYKRIGVSKNELLPVIKDIAKKSADWPEENNDWEKELKRDLKGLKQKRRGHWGGYDNPGQPVIIQEKTTWVIEPEDK